MPPDYKILPEPAANQPNQKTQKKNSSDNIEKLLTNKKNSSSKNKLKTSSSIEKLILEKIK